MNAQLDQPDILHPLVSLEWEECKELPLGTNYAQAVWRKDKLWVGAMLTEGKRRDHARLYVYSRHQNDWNTVDTPIYYFAMVTHMDKLVIVNGREFISNDTSGPLTDKVLTISEELDQWEEVEGVPPMNTKRCATCVVSVGRYLIVAGGYIESGMSDIVEVFNGHQWAYGTSLPVSSVELKSVVHNGDWCLMGGRNQKRNVFCTSLEDFQNSEPDASSIPVIVWKTFGSQLPYERSSPAVFGNRLIAVGGENNFPGSQVSTSTIHAYSEHTKSWVHVGDLPNDQRLHSSCTVVLPTGELMVIGGMIGYTTKSRHVYISTLKVDFYDPDSNMTKMALTKLEKGPKQVSLKSVLNSENMTRFLREAGITYHALRTKRFKPDSYMDISSFSIESWISGSSHFAPSWRNLLEVMKNIVYESEPDKDKDNIEKKKRLKKVAEDIEVYLKERQETQSSTSSTMFKMWCKSKDNLDANKKQQVDSVLEAMERNGTIKRTVIQGYFIGPARSGKNCFMNRLLQRIPARVSPSTGVADSVVQVKCGKKEDSIFPAVARMDGSTWRAMDDDDQVLDFMQIITENRGHVSNCRKCVTESSTLFHAHSVEISHCVVQEATGEDHVLASDPPDQQALSNTSPSVCTSGFPESILRGAVKRKGSPSALPREMKSLYLTNTGGQVEFQDVLPLLVSGPSIFFYTFRLDKDLNDKYEIEYELSGNKKSKPYKSSLTILEGIVQTLASIDAMVTYIYQGRQKMKVKPKVFFVGTHKDKLDRKSRKEKLKSIDQQLKEAVSPFMVSDIVKYASEECLAFAINNFSEGDSDFHVIRSRIDDLVNKTQYMMTFPSNWLAFSFILKQHEAPVISFNECFKLARENGINGINTEEELRDVLLFLHSTTGLIRYFPYRDNEIDKIVVTHPQFLFNKVTELIIGTFTFENAGKVKQDDFKQKGIFSLTDFKRISDISTDSNSVLNHDTFGKMLETLRIIARFTTPKDEIKYFLPCVLGHADPAKVKLATTDIPTLVVTFDCGYCPKGVAGALIKYLMTNEMKSQFVWRLVQSEIFRDQASFRVGPYDKIIIKSFATHLEIVCIPHHSKQRKNCTIAGTCKEVCKAVESGISQVMSDVFAVDVKHSFTFLCVCPSCNAHPAEIFYHENQPLTLYCEKVDECFDLPTNYEIWCLGTAPCGPTIRLTAKNLKVLINQLSDYATLWYDIGIQLDFRPGELDNIRASPKLHETAPISWLETMLYKWFQWAPGDERGSEAEANLEDLKIALRSKAVGLGAVAQQLHI